MDYSIEDFKNLKNRSNEKVSDDILTRQLYQQGRDDYPHQNTGGMSQRKYEMYMMGYNVSAALHNNEE